MNANDFFYSDDPSENQAVRAFLMLYGANAGGQITIKAMRLHMKCSGFDGCWPDWVNEPDILGLTKGGAQSWLRHLFDLGNQALAAKTVVGPMMDARCKCPMTISLLGDGCRYCQPQEYIDRLHDQIEDDRKEAEAAPTVQQGGESVEPRNQGHGHVTPRPDGAKARCGGPLMCKVCWLEQSKKAQPAAAHPVIDGKIVDPFGWLASLKCNSLHLTRDDGHACNYMTASDWIDDHHEEFADVNPDELATMRATNTIWSLQIYPDTPIGSYTFYGATAESAIRSAIATTKGDNK